jgi:osmotically-inducible protein OsmY
MNLVSTVKNVVVPVAALMWVAALSGCATVADGKLTSDVETNIKQNPEFGANRVHVQTIDRVVYLRGTLSGGEQRADAESAALHTQGVTQVVNDIAVTK